jgi:hypothetical protein
MNADERRSDEPVELAVPGENGSENAPGQGLWLLVFIGGLSNEVGCSRRTLKHLHGPQMNADERRSDKPVELAGPGENGSENSPGQGFGCWRSSAAYPTKCVVHEELANTSSGRR